MGSYFGTVPNCNIQGMAFGLHAQPYNVYDLYFAAVLSAFYRIFCAAEERESGSDRNMILLQQCPHSGKLRILISK